MVNEIINVVMLGHSGAGKTTYMASSYAYFNPSLMSYLPKFNRRFSCFTIRANDSNVHKRLGFLAQNLFNKQKFPSGTDVMDKYNFSLEYKSSIFYPSKKTFQFVWHDYRGGIFNEFSNETEDVVKLQKIVADADAVILFIDGASLVNGNPRSISRELARLTNYLGLLSDKNPNGFVISICVTKADLISRQIFESNEELKQFITRFQNMNGVVGVQCVVSCLRSVNVDVPIMTTTAGVILHRKKIKENLIAQNKILIQQKFNESQMARQKSGIVNSISCMFEGKKSWSKIADEYLSAMFEIENKNKTLIKENSSLVKYTKSIAKGLVNKHNNGEIKIFGDLSLWGLKTDFDH